MNQMTLYCLSRHYQRDKTLKYNCINLLVAFYLLLKQLSLRKFTEVKVCFSTDNLFSFLVMTDSSNTQLVNTQINKEQTYFTAQVRT